MTKEYVIKDLFKILVTAIVNVINYVMMENIDICKNYKCRKKLVAKLLEECSENIDENEMIYNKTLNDYKNICNSCTIYIVFFVIAF